jgi:predicted RNA-binding protein with PIN domain
MLFCMILIALNPSYEKFTNASTILLFAAYRQRNWTKESKLAGMPS